MSNENATPQATPDSPPPLEEPSADPTGAAPPEQPRDPQTGQFTAPEPPQPNLNEPAWAQGKSREELLSLADGALQAMRTGFDPIGQPPTGQTHAPAQQPPQAEPQMPTDPYEDGYHEKMRAYLDWRENSTLQRVQQMAQPLFQNVGALARAQVERDPKFSKAFERWPHEVETLLQGLQPQQRTVESYEMACDMVLGRHWQELARESAETVPSNAPDTARGSDVAVPTNPTYDDPAEEFWASGHPYVMAAKTRNVTLRDFRDTASIMGLDVKSYIESIKRSPGTWGATGVTHANIAGGS